MSSRDLSSGPVSQRLLQLAGPMTVGILAGMSVALVDTYFLGRLGTEELAAISFAFPIVFTVMSLSIGLGAGAASVVSRAIGHGDREEVRRLSTDSIGLAVVLVALVSGAGIATVRPLFALLGAEGAVLDHVVAYMRIWYVGMVFLVVPMVANNILRAGGDALVPSAIMVGVAALNLALTPLLVFGLWGLPRLEVEGAAWASLIARAVTAVVSLGVLVFRERLIAFALPPTAALLASWRRVLFVGVPAALGNAVNPLGIAVVTAIVASFGTASVAAFGVATRVEAFAAIPMLALSAAIGPVAGQSWGADRQDRVPRALRLAFAFCAAWSVLAAAAFWLLGRSIAEVFTDEAEVAREAATYLRVVSLSLAGYGVTVIAAGAFNALGKPVTALGYNLVRTLGLLVPMAWLASVLGGVGWVFAAVALANMAAGAGVAWHALRWLSCAERGDCDPQRGATAQAA
jgi:putative MATE family efflux protein